MWHKSHSTVSPALLDRKSSPTTVYVRKNVTVIPAHTSADGTEEPDMYEYDEIAVPKKDWTIYEQLITQENSMADVEDALIEIAGMIGGE